LVSGGWHFAWPVSRPDGGHRGQQPSTDMPR